MSHQKQLEPVGTVRVTGSSREARIRIRECELLVQEGPDKGRVFRIAQPSVVVGKGEGTDVTLTDPSVSRKHFSIEQHEDGHLLRDLGSTNGTTVNGTRSREVFLEPGATICAGHTKLGFQARQSHATLPSAAADSFAGLIGRSESMRQLFGYLRQIAPTQLSVVLLGETGTGKDRIARAIHDCGPRRDRPFVVFDCGAVEPTLLGAALFGHREGAFTGATAARRGACVSAHTGTLFLDEIGELPLDMQPKLLRVLEGHEVQPIGSDQLVRVDLRIVCATHRDLSDLVARGQFRQDLYYRLAGFILEVPPLRDRQDDVVGLARHFLSEIRPGLELSEASLCSLRGHDWPGNVRELRNVVERAAALTRGETIEPGDLVIGNLPRPAKTPAPGPKAGATRTLDDAEREAILSALEATAGNKTHAARILGVSRQTLRDKMDRYSIPDVTRKGT